MRGLASRRTWLGTLASLSLAGVAGCVRQTEGVAGVVAFPERSLSYAPLLAAIRDGLYTTPAVRLAPLLRSGGRRVAAAVVDGAADAGAVSLADFLDTAAEGAPLVAFAALSRRFGGQLVVATDARVPDRSYDALAGGGWRALPFGLQTGAEGTERVLRFLVLSRAPAGPPGSDPGSGGSARSAETRLPLLSGDPLAGEPRWIGYTAGDGLVAALRDGRIAAFLGRSMAAAQAILLGGSEIGANFSDGSVAPDVTRALCTVLVARRDRLQAPSQRTDRLLGTLVRACARAAAALGGPEGPAVAARAMPKDDALHLGTALRLDAPSPSASVYAADGRLPTESIERLIELTALAGRHLRLDPSALTTDRFSA